MKPYKEIVQIMPVSDGDPSHRPKNPEYIQITRPTLYLEKIASLWMQNLHQARPGKQLKLNLSQGQLALSAFSLQNDLFSISFDKVMQIEIHDRF